MRRIICCAVALVVGAGAMIPFPAVAQVFVGAGPPPPRFEVVPPPRPDAIWVPGYWDWNGYNYVWVGGYWVAQQPGYVYVPPVWTQERNGWRFNHGGWERHEGERHEGERHEGERHEFAGRPEHGHDGERHGGRP
ncbi:YXWGXW repeat-containing protein [Massilia horti]|uniref:YXWGXW repeat-containing protein n=1 Tax=Massilia horti TaxID=2562153 RepID=A0A4Y9T7I2_9BURK|nr:YXWGXW repeat-containing protein [Massilia horti]TFW34611.1 hypothetical protein E4O92_03350 [Massilia horti]